MSHYNTMVFTKHPGDIDRLLAPFNERVHPNSPYAEFFEEEDGELDPATGKKGFWRNPNAKYDYYIWGGGWRGTMKLQEGKEGMFAPLEFYDDPERNRPGYCDRALAADIDFSPGGETGVPYAYVTDEGEWHAPGNMGWFGCDDSTPEAREAYVKEFYEYVKAAIERGLTVSMMDLHI
jgi:hypothetical protein